MTKHLLCNAPFYGYICPTLPLAQVLFTHGAQIIYYNADNFKDASDEERLRVCTASSGERYCVGFQQSGQFRE